MKSDIPVHLKRKVLLISYYYYSYNYYYYYVHLLISPWLQTSSWFSRRCFVRVGFSL